MDDTDYPCLRKVSDGQMIKLITSPFSIGRGLHCDYIVPETTISRTHCILKNLRNVWTVKDTSTNGTIVNETILNKATSEPLKDFDSISIILGDFTPTTYTFFTSHKNVEDEVVKNLKTVKIKIKPVDGENTDEKKTEIIEEIRIEDEPKQKKLKKLDLIDDDSKNEYS